MVKIAAGYRIADGYIEVTAETDKGDRQIKRFLRDTRGRLHDEQGRYAKEGELAGLRYGEELTKGADKKSEQGFRGMFARMGKRFAGAGKMIGGLFANKITAAVIGGLGALPAAISVISQTIGGAINIGGAAAALAPAALGGLVLSMMALKTAFSGLGAALKAGLSGDMAALAAATKDMAPAMQQAVKAISQLNPLIKELKKGVQQNFWSQFVADIKPLGQTYLPMVYKAMASIAAGFGIAAHEIAAFLLQTNTAQGMGLAFDNIAESVRNVVAGLAPLAKAFFTIFQVGASFLPGLTSGFAGLATTFNNFVTRAAGDGSLQRWIQSGLDKLGALAAALGDLIGIFQSIGRAVPAGGLIAAFGQLLDMVNRFFQTVQGQEVLTAFFSRLQALGNLVMGLVKGALPGLLVFSSALLTAFQALEPVAPVVGKAIGDALSALAPLLPVIGKVLAILLTLASGVLSTLAAELGPMIALWGQLASALADKFLPVIQDMISQGLPVAIQLGKNLADAFAPLIPVILQLADAFMGGLVQAMPALLAVGQQLLPVITQLAQQIGGAFLDALTQLTPYIPTIVAAFVLLVQIFAALMGSYLPKVIMVFGFLVVAIITVSTWIAWLGLKILDLIGWFARIGPSVLGFIQGAGAALIGWVGSVVSWFASLPSKIWNALVGLVTLIPQVFSQALNAAAFAVGFAIGTIGNFFMTFPGKVRGWLAALPGIIGGLFTSAWNSARQATSNAINIVTGLASSLGSRIRGAISNLISILPSIASAAWNGLRNAFTSGLTGAVNIAKGLPGKIKGALSGAGSWLVGVGADIVRGLGAGIESMLGWVYDKAAGIAGRVLAGAKHALGIGSPSKVMAKEVGRWIPPGIQAGIDGAMPKLLDYIDGTMASLAARPNINVASPNVAVGAPSVMVLLDGEEIAAKVVTPDRVAKANVEGQRRRNFLNTGRAPATA